MCFNAVETVFSHLSTDNVHALVVKLHGRKYHYDQDRHKGSLASLVLSVTIAISALLAQLCHSHLYFVIVLLHALGRCFHMPDMSERLLYHFNNHENSDNCYNVTVRVTILQDGWTALHVATCKNAIAIVRVLLERGASVFKTTKVVVPALSCQQL
jgi:ankyrin repeat protein